MHRTEPSDHKERAGSQLKTTGMLSLLFSGTPIEPHKIDYFFLLLKCQFELSLLSSEI